MKENGGQRSVLRSAHGRSRDIIREPLCFSQQHIGNLERGQHNPATVPLYELVQSFDVSHSELIEP